MVSVSCHLLKTNRIANYRGNMFEPMTSVMRQVLENLDRQNVRVYMLEAYNQDWSSKMVELVVVGFPLFLTLLR